MNTDFLGFHEGFKDKLIFDFKNSKTICVYLCPSVVNVSSKATSEVINLVKKVEIKR